MNNYRDIIRTQIRQVILKKSQTTEQKQKDYWDWVLSQLVADLRDYETGGKERWLREPHDQACIHFQTRVSPFHNLDEFFRQFFEGFWT